jgi:sulfite exporter TauE/SafE
MTCDVGCSVVYGEFSGDRRGWARREECPRRPERKTRAATRERAVFARLPLRSALFCAPFGLAPRLQRERLMNAAWSVAMLTGAGLAAAASMHCLAMCGPLTAAAQARGGARAGARYLLGRLVSYVTLGALAGSFGQSLLATPWARWAEALLAWSLAALLLYTAAGFFGLASRPKLLQLGRAPRTSLASRLLAAAAHDPLLLGAASALLPCAALYGALVASAALGRGALGALAMAGFALLTSPALLGAAQLGRLAQLGPRGKRAVGSLLVAGALLTAWRPVPGLSQGGTPSCHAHAASPATGAR